MKRALCAMVAAIACAAGPASATEPFETPVPTLGADIPLEEWTAMAEGRTLSYAIDGRLWALERYEPGSNRVTLQFRDGSCLDGTWDYTAPFYCFHWDATGTSCFRHTRLEEQILILETQGGLETGGIQVMTGVSDLPLTCGAPLMS